jgi:hypothetical protein
MAKLDQQALPSKGYRKKVSGELTVQPKDCEDSRDSGIGEPLNLMIALWTHDRLFLFWNQPAHLYEKRTTAGSEYWGVRNSGVGITTKYSRAGKPT